MIINYRVKFQDGNIPVGSWQLVSQAIAVTHEVTVSPMNSLVCAVILLSLYLFLIILY